MLHLVAKAEAARIRVRGLGLPMGALTADFEQGFPSARRYLLLAAWKTAGASDRDLMCLEWLGDDRAKEFYDKWVEIDSRIEAGSVSDNAKMEIFYNIRRQSPEVRLAVNHWQNLSEADRTYSILMDAFRRHLKDKKELANFQKALGKKTKSTVAPAQENALDESQRKPKKKKKMPQKLSKEDIAAVEAKIQEAVQSQAWPVASKLLKNLAESDVSVDLLKTTTVGKTVAALKKAADAKLVMAAKGLVARWKQMVRDADAASS